MEIVIGGLAAACAGCITNPLEVLKTRMQLQGELMKKGQHVVHYKNVFHAGYVVAKTDGLSALQKGLVPTIWVQFIMNGFRFGSYHFADKRGLIRDSNGNLRFYNSVMVSGTGGVIGHLLASPFFMVKTHLQAQASQSIAVGHQHSHKGTFYALQIIFNQQGVKGLFRGGVAVIPRAFSASVAQLTSFAYSKAALLKYEYFQDRKILATFLSSMIGGTALSIIVTPFDLVLTRLYNQPVSNLGRGELYRSYMDCVVKIYKTEGISAFYKGVGPMYLRLGPHSVLCLMFWERFKEIYDSIL